MTIRQNMLKGSKKYGASEPINEESVSSGGANAKNDFLDITALIRSIQRAEGNPDCFFEGSRRLWPT